MSSREDEITALLQRSKFGDVDAENRVVRLLYDQLHRIASARIREERRALTLSATALVHETYLRMFPHVTVDFRSRSHFFAVAATVMRHILVDRARSRMSGKRVPLPSGTEETWNVLDPSTDALLVDLDEALKRLAAVSPRQCRVVELRYFAGLSELQIAGMLGITRRTVARDWQIARTWLHSQIFP